MGTLRNCIRKAGKLIKPSEAEALHQRARQYVADGRPAAEAEQRAVQEFYEHAATQLESLYQQTRPAPVAPAPVVPAAPRDVAFQTRNAQIESPAFKNWFGDSKVVDAEGKPLVVYKGMYPYDWTSSNKEPVTSIGRTTEFPAFNRGEPGVKIAGFFGDIKTANRFAGVLNEGAIYPVFLSLKQPYIIDAEGKMAGTIQFGTSGQEFRDAIRSGKYDGVIIRNTKDEGTIFIALKPEQIKSAIANRGTFDPTNADIALQTAERRAAQLPAEASKAQNFIGVVNRLQRMGIAVDVFARSFFNAGVRTEIESQIKTLESQLPTATGPARAELTRQIARRKERLGEISQAQGAAFTPNHIALSVDDVQNASLANLQTLLHEAAEALAMRLNPVMKGRIQQAIDRSLDKLRDRAAEASAKSGVPLARETDAFDLLSETLAQELTAAGVPDAPSLAQAIWRWIKDLYYRTAMALQAGFGVQPSDEMALNWFGNQLERLVGGDYDYRFARLLDRFGAQPMDARVKNYKQPRGTPGGIADFFDPFLQRTVQPGVLPYTQDGVDWNVQFQQVAPQKTALGEEIPEVEARARIQAAALNSLNDEATAIHQATSPEIPWTDWWRAVGTGDDPRALLADMEQKLPGVATAKIGGDRMTNVMSQLAGLEARRLIENWNVSATSRLSDLNQSITEESDTTIAAAKEVNRLEADRRNALQHEASLKENLKAMVRRFVRENSSARSLAEQQGALAKAVRDAEGLLDSDPIPEAYQQAFKQILDGEIPLFSYMRAIAELDLPLSDLSHREVLKAIKANADTNPQLAQLVRNNPLMVALATLARRNAGQMDEIHLGWLKNSEQYRKIHDELETVRRASDATLREMIAGMDDSIKGATLRQRIVRDYVKRRRNLLTARNRVATAQMRADAIKAALPAIGKAEERAQQQGSQAPSDWTPDPGAEFTEMRLSDDGTWSTHKRILQFNPDGSAVESDAIRRAVGLNSMWLQLNADKAGSAGYERIKKQTLELKMRDLKAFYPATQALKFTRFLELLGTQAKRLGGRSAQEIAQMLTAFEAVRFAHSQETQVKSQAWSNAIERLKKSTGIKDNGVLRESILDPVNYFLNTNPGLDEAAAIRQAVRLARSRLTQEPAENFNEVMEQVLRTTKDVSEFLINIAQEQGAFVADPRLKSSLRRAVAQGWLTNMRSLDSAVVSAVTRDMQDAGWKVTREIEKDRQGRERPKVGKAVTFQDFTSADTAQANTPALDQFLQKLFPERIKRDWLVPFINKGGVEVFTQGDDPIPQLALQNAWARSGGNVLAWIDNLGAEIGLPQPEEMEGGATTDPVADFRLSMLRQLDGLYGLESRLAAEASVTRDLFDPMGPKPHVMMDARLNDKLPPEHLDFATYDPHTAQMLLAEIAFHAKFGRNGIRLQNMLDRLYGDVQADKARYERLKGTTEKERIAEAALEGYDYKALERSAQRSKDIDAFKKRIEALFSTGSQGSVFEEAKIGMELMNFIAGQIVDNPKTGLYDVVSLFERPFGMRSLGPSSIKSSVRAIGSAGKGALGSLLGAFNLHLFHSSQYYKDAVQTRGASRNQPWAQAVSDIGPGGRQNFTDRVLVRPMRFIRYVQNKGPGSPIQSESAAQEFPRMAPVPGLGVNNYIGQIAAAGNASASAMELEQIIRQGADYFATHKEDFENPNFQFRPKDLGFGTLDVGVFDWWKSKAVDYNLGTLEDIVRDAIPRMAKGERIVTEQQAIRATQMAMEEFSGQSGLLTTPSFMQENPWLRRALPLLRWPFWRTAKGIENLGTIDGKRDYKQLLRGLGTLAMWNLPIGLAFTFALDQYDEDLLGKKSNLPATGKTASLPFVGPIAEAIMADRSIPDTLKAYLVRSARAGNIGGLASDLVGQFASPTDAQSGRRIFSLDQRVLAMSQFLNFQQAISNFAHQDWTATWASVWSPLMRSLGGNGALHGIDMANQLLGLDNAQSRQINRQNAALWLRASAGEIGLEVRAGGSGTPTPMSVWTREMWTAASANDRIGFAEAYRKALDVARANVAKDPSVAPANREREAESRVLSGWRGRDPLSIFARRPTEQEMRRLYAIMDETGQQEVREALTRYAQFSRLIQASPEQRQGRALERRLSAPPANPFRRETALAR